MSPGLETLSACHASCAYLLLLGDLTGHSSSNSSSWDSESSGDGGDLGDDCRNGLDDLAELDLLVGLVGEGEIGLSGVLHCVLDLIQIGFEPMGGNFCLGRLLSQFSGRAWAVRRGWLSCACCAAL